MLHNTVSVSVAQQSESAICIHMFPYPLPLEPPSYSPYPTALGHHKAPSQSPCVMLLLPPANYFTVGSVCMLMLLSLCPSFPLPTPPLCPQVHSLCLRPYSCPAIRSISTIFFLDSFFFLTSLLEYNCFTMVC